MVGASSWCRTLVERRTLTSGAPSASECLILGPARTASAHATRMQGKTTARVEWSRLRQAPSAYSRERQRQLIDFGYEDAGDRRGGPPG